MLDECCFISPGKEYKASNTDKTYRALARLGILKFTNISYQQLGVIDDKIGLDAYVVMTKGKSQNVSLSLEGTNSDCDCGFGIGASYQHRD